MSRSNPYMDVWCDRCREEETYVDLTPLSKGAYDARTVDAQLDRMGWKFIGEEDICPECWSEED